MVVVTHRGATSVAALFRAEALLLVRLLYSLPRRRVAPVADVCTRRTREPSGAGVLLLVGASLPGEEAEEVSVLA